MSEQEQPSAPLRAGDVVEVEIERIVPGGAGLAHAQGRTLFVTLAAPGDRLRVRVERVKGAVAFASIVELLAAGPARIEPPCPYFGRCGGCDFQQLTYPAQLAAKIEIIRDCLRRIAHLDPPADIQITSAPAIDLYCGVGLFTLPLARRFARVTGVEANARACAYARRNLVDAQLTNGH